MGFGSCWIDWGSVYAMCRFRSDVIDLSRERTRLIVVMDGRACV